MGRLSIDRNMLEVYKYIYIYIHIYIYRNSFEMEQPRVEQAADPFDKSYYYNLQRSNRRIESSPSDVILCRLIFKGCFSTSLPVGCLPSLADHFSTHP